MVYCIFQMWFLNMCNKVSEEQRKWLIEVKPQSYKYSHWSFRNFITHNLKNSGLYKWIMMQSSTLSSPTQITIVFSEEVNAESSCFWIYHWEPLSTSVEDIIMIFLIYFSSEIVWEFFPFKASRLQWTFPRTVL